MPRRIVTRRACLLQARGVWRWAGLALLMLVASQQTALVTRHPGSSSVPNAAAEGQTAQGRQLLALRDESQEPPLPLAPVHHGRHADGRIVGLPQQEADPELGVQHLPAAEPAPLANVRLPMLHRLTDMDTVERSIPPTLTLGQLPQRAPPAGSPLI